MILQALYDYYQRKCSSEDSESRLPMAGFEKKEIPFVIVLDRVGNFVNLEDKREAVGKKKHARAVEVPKSQNRQGTKAYEKPNLLWDHYGFVLKAPKLEKPGDAPTEKTIRDAELQHQNFVRLVDELNQRLDDEGVKAVAAFLHRSDFKPVFSHPLWDECRRIKGCNLSFRLTQKSELVCQSPRVIEYVTGRESSGKNDVEEGVCLVTGDIASIQRLHSPISGVGPKPAPFSAINDGVSPAFSSYGKSQGFNFPVSTDADFKYTTALNHLLRKGSSQRLQVGDSSTVFWAEKPSAMETGVVDIFGEPSKDNPDLNTEKIKELFRSIHFGRYTGEDAGDRFYVLGLAPNAARIAVRFWQVTTVGELAERIVQHFEDIRIEHGGKQPEYLPLFRLLASVAVQGKADNIPPNLAGDFLRAILDGLPYPRTLLSAAVQRCRAEREITYPRAALIKGCLNRISPCRTFESKSESKEELTVSLDPDNPNPGYRLGRLFAVLENIQEKANPGINATIRDRYYGSASSTPVAVFPTLIKLSKHHLSKIEKKGLEIYFDRLLGEIMEAIEDFPPHLSLEDQGRFAIGYYHQRQEFFKKRTTESENQTEGETA